MTFLARQVLTKNQNDMSFRDRSVCGLAHSMTTEIKTSQECLLMAENKAQ
jgi:hypothetical protein